MSMCLCLILSSIFMATLPLCQLFYISLARLVNQDTVLLSEMPNVPSNHMSKDLKWFLNLVAHNFIRNTCPHLYVSSLRVNRWTT